MVHLSCVFSVFLAPVVSAAPSGAGAFQEPLQENQQAESRSTDRQFLWLSGDSEMVGQEVGRRRLNKLRKLTDYIETEQEVTEVDEHTTHILFRAYGRDPQGRRRLVDVVEEEQTTFPDGSQRAVRTNTSVDVNGRMRVTHRETQETLPQGSDTFRTVTTIERPNTRSSLTVVERIEQTERHRGENAIEIERTQLLLDPDGRWETAVKRNAYIQEVGGVIRTDESIYRRGGHRRLSLSEEVVSLEWQEDDGTEYRTIETQAPNLYGEMQVVRELAIVRTIAADGSGQTVQETAMRSGGSTSDEFQPVERIVETRDPRGERTETSVEATDSTGRLSPVSSFRTVTSSSSGGKKTLRKVTGSIPDQ